jgi:hypothetical protein
MGLESEWPNVNPWRGQKRVSMPTTLSRMSTRPPDMLGLRMLGAAMGTLRLRKRISLKGEQKSQGPTPL